MRNLKIVLPVAGIGKRLRPHTLTTPKVLLEVAGKPILGHIMDRIKNLPVEEAIFIVGHLGNQIEDYIKSSFTLNSHFVYQNELLGLGHAIYLASEFVEPSDDLLIVLGDTIFEIDLSEIVKSEKSLVGVKEVEDPSRFGVVQLENGSITKFVEKPKKFISNLAIVGIYFIKQAAGLFQALENIIRDEQKTRGEFQLTDALQKLIKTGHDIGVFPVEGWFDCGKPETLLTTNQYLLDKYHKHIEIEGSLIIPPVFIAQNALLKSSIIGPHTSIGKGCNITDSIIKNSIINSSASVKSTLLQNSIIGKSAMISGESHQLNAGDSPIL